MISTSSPREYIYFDTPTEGNWGVCPHCDAVLDYIAPFPLLYDMSVVAALIPTSEVALRKALSINKTLAGRRYRLTRNGRQQIPHRLLTATEIRRIRGYMLRYADDTMKPRMPTEMGL